MLRICIHIEPLLIINDCVIIPDFGGFVLQTLPFSYIPSEHLFRPSYKDIVFNSSLNHNDGLFTKRYMLVYKIDEVTAQSWIQKDVIDLVEALNRDGEVVLEGLGVFRKKMDKITFELAEHKTLIDVQSYGLTFFNLPPISKENITLSIDEDRSVAKKSKNTIYLPINTHLLRIIGSSAAAAVLFFAITIPIEDVNQGAYTANFIPSELFSNQAIVPIHSEINDLATSDTSPVQEEATPINHGQNESTIESSLKNDVHSRIYYVIIGSFYSEKQANRFISEIDTSACKNVGIVKQGENYRVYGGTFDNRQDAEAYLKSIKQNYSFQSAWLTIGK